MEKATGGGKAKTGRKTPRRASRRSPVVGEEHKLRVNVPVGSRFKGYDDFVVQDLKMEGRVIRYRRERWLTREGKLIVAPLPTGLRGHFGPELVRFILLQHHQGQVTVDRITALLNSLGLVISKRQVLRLLISDVATFGGEANAVLRAGLESAPWITVDDTGARHRARNGVTTQIGAITGQKRALHLLCDDVLQEPHEFSGAAPRRLSGLCHQCRSLGLYARTPSRRHGNRATRRA